ncbi:MAG: phosphoribosyltransferase family protein [Bacteroidota bacterium]
MSKVFSLVPLHKNSRWNSVGKDFSRLIFPASCVSCNEELTINEHEICLFCTRELSFTDFEKYDEATSLDQKFWGRIQLENTFALCYFEQDKAIQSIIHHLKYKNNYKLGVLCGEMIGRRLKDLSILTTADALIPVPLHHRKEFIRSYNQSEALAKGIQKCVNLPIIKDLIHKKLHTESQTRNNRFLRWEKAQEQFQLNKKKHFNFQHIVIVDDVITTGSTLEAMAQEIRSLYPTVKISIISLAVVQ